jgi:hypothetical protein
MPKPAVRAPARLVEYAVVGGMATLETRQDLVDTELAVVNRNASPGDPAN